MAELSKDVGQMVRSAHQEWNAAFNRGDAAAVASLYTEDASLLPPTHALIAGTTAIEEFWEGVIGAGFKDHDIETLGVQSEGGLMVVSGKWWADGPSEGDKSQPKHFEGTIVTVLRRQNDGSWKASLHTWN